MVATARRLVLHTLAAAWLGAAGCSFARPRDTDPPAELLARPWVEPDAPPDADPDAAVAEGLASVLGGRQPAGGLAPCPPEAARPVNVLCLSAGGKYSAFGAGLLCGWTEAGTRPEFDVVTGSSSGAVLATFAFLGPKYDGEIRRLACETRDRDLFCYRPTWETLRSGALASPAPLRRQIAAGVTDAAVAELREAHARGRRLYVATLNIRTKRVTVWDLGGIAAGGRPDAADLVRKVLLAACSIPGMTPPVEFEVTVNGRTYTEHHADGGAVTQSFARLGQRPGGPPRAWPPGSNVYCVAAGKLYSDPAPCGGWLPARVGSAVSATLYALYRAEMMKTYALCLAGGATFNLTAIPQDYPLPAGSMKATADDTRGLFDLGYRSAVGGIPWRHLPPGCEPGEQEAPRTGLTFETR